MSYANDNSSIIFYTISEDYNGRDYYLEKKINRQMFHYNKGTLIQSRLYPGTTDCQEELVNQYRQLTETAIANSLKVPNLWKNTSSKTRTRRSTFHYQDYTHYATNQVYLSETEPHNVSIGGKAYCVNCGQQKLKKGWRAANEYFICEDCRNRYRYGYGY
jgi:hypothetical protein